MKGERPLRLEMPSLSHTNAPHYYHVSPACHRQRLPDPSVKTHISHWAVGTQNCLLRKDDKGSRKVCLLAWLSLPSEDLFPAKLVLFDMLVKISQAELNQFC